jgi:hypothetical protein
MLRDVYIDALLNKLEDKTYRDYAFDALRIFRSGPCTISGNCDISIPLIDIYCQLPRGLELNLIDLIEAALAWQRILSNKLLYRFVKINNFPKRDSDIVGNNLIVKELKELYPDQIIDAEFSGGKFGADGFIEFAEPPISRRILFPLEVGYCKSDQILTHIFKHQCFARFPYKHKFIVLFEDTDFVPIEL